MPFFLAPLSSLPCRKYCSHSIVRSRGEKERGSELACALLCAAYTYKVGGKRGEIEEREIRTSKQIRTKKNREYQREYRVFLLIQVRSVISRAAREEGRVCVTIPFCATGCRRQRRQVRHTHVASTYTHTLGESSFLMPLRCLSPHVASRATCLPKYELQRQKCKSRWESMPASLALMQNFSLPASPHSFLEACQGDRT